MSKVNDINNITLPVYKRLKKDIESSSEVLSRLKLDTTNNKITFPKGVLPTKIIMGLFNDNIPMYFNYERGLLIDSTNNSIGGSFNIEYTEDGCVKIGYDGRSRGNISGVEYLLSDSINENKMNTYFLYYSGSGTKLYKHFFQGAQGYSYKIISTQSTTINSTGSNFEDTKVISASVGGKATSWCVLRMTYIGQGLLIEFIENNPTFTILTETLTSISDSVTEL